MALLALATSSHALAEVVFYDGDNFVGRTFDMQRQVQNFDRVGFDNRASSVVVLSGRLELCDGAGYSGRCFVLRPGRYKSLSPMSLNDRVSSARMLGERAHVEETRYAPEYTPVYDNRRRNRERLFEAEVTYARAVYGEREQRCWIERERVDRGSRDGNVGGAVIGAVLGGILGHQIGDGSGRDGLATAGGAVAGGAIGYRVGANGRDDGGRDVQRCTSDSRQSHPDYWDVTYEFRGREHHIQSTYDPGQSVTVNRRGEPRYASR